MAENNLKELTDLLKLADKKDKKQPYILYHDNKEYSFEIKQILTVKIADVIIAINKKYPLDLYDSITLNLYNHEQKNGELDYDKFKKENNYSDRLLTVYHEDNKEMLAMLDNRDLSKERFELHKILFKEVVNIKEPEILELINGKTKKSKEFWENQNMIMLKEIYDNFRSKMQ